MIVRFVSLFVLFVGNHFQCTPLELTCQPSHGRNALAWVTMTTLYVCTVDCCGLWFSNLMWFWLKSGVKCTWFVL